MGRGSPGEAPSNIYAEVEMEAPPGAEGSRCIFWHSVLQKCQAGPVPGSQVSGGAGKIQITRAS